MNHLRTIARRLVQSYSRRRADSIQLHDAGHGYDQFGANADWVALGQALLGPLHDHYFRVEAHNAKHLPVSGPCIVVANHSGTLPFDGAMLWANILRVTSPARIPRVIADYFVPHLPYAGQVFSRVGVVGGSRQNAHALLDQQELLLIFPEGVRGISKPFSERYRLQRWHWGHCELAIRHRCPIIPTAVVGAEEQMPQVGRIDHLHPFGAPFVPIPATPLPLPVRYHIHYGQPIELFRDYSIEDADNPKQMQAAANTIKSTVQSLIDHGLRTRKGIFR